MGAGRALVAGAFVAAALAGCGGDDEPAPLPAAADTIDFSTPDFKDGAAIPAALTCDGAGKPPTITWRGLPSGAIELVLLVDDATPTSRTGRPTACPWRTGGGLAPSGQFPAGTKNGKNSAGKNGWTPPCPPEGDDPHTLPLRALRDPEGQRPRGRRLAGGRPRRAEGRGRPRHLHRDLRPRQQS